MLPAMQKIDKFDQAAKVVAVCVPPVVMAQVGCCCRARSQGGQALSLVAGVRQLSTQRRVGRYRGNGEELQRLAIAKAAVTHVAIGTKLGLGPAEDHTSYCNR